MTKTRFVVTGMTCSACSAHVENAVSKLAGVRRASVNLLTNSMTAEYDESLLSAEDIARAVVKAGYGAAPEEGSGVPARENKGAKERADMRAQATKEMRVRLIVSLVFMVVLMYVGMGHMFGAPLPSFLTGTENAVSYAFLQILLCLPIIYVNRSYYINGFKRLFTLSPNMDSLIAVGSAASLAYGIFAIFRMSYGLGAGDTALVERYLHDLYFESAGMILALVTVGKYLESLSKRRTGDALDRLRGLVPKGAIVLRDGEEREVDSETLAAGDVIVVKAGMSVPADAVVTDGHAFVDESAISGESVPVEKTEGAKLIGGTVNRTGHVTARVTAVGGESVLSKIIKLVEDAGADKAPIAKIADKISGVFVPVVMGIALVTLIGWLAGGYAFEHALTCAVSVLVISCPCALGLATPVAVMVGTGKGAENGVLFKSGEALETLHDIKFAVFDKTGTVTEGSPEVAEITFRGRADEILSAVAGIERKSEHPLGDAVVAYAAARGIEFAEAEEFETLPGKGVTATVNGVRYAVGNAALMQDAGVPEESYSAELARVSEEGKTPLLVAREGEYLGLIATSDRVKPHAKQAVEELKKLGVRVVMLTGDNERTARAVAAQAGIDEVFAGVLPGDKEAKIAELKKQGKVAMVGDGINDAPALTRADVGIAIGSGSDIAVESADVVLIKDDPLDVVTAVRLSRATIRNIKQNLFWALFYNALCIPVAAGVLYVPFDFRLSPMIGAAAMSVSSIFVVTNALRLRLFKATRAEEKCADGACAVGAGSGAAPEGNEPSDGASAPLSEESEKEREMTENTLQRSEADMKTYVLSIEGMMCSHCTGRVEKALRAVAGVADVAVSLEQKNAVVSADESVTADALKAAVEAQDYPVTAVAEK